MTKEHVRIAMLVSTFAVLPLLEHRWLSLAVFVLGLLTMMSVFKRDRVALALGVFCTTCGLLIMIGLPPQLVFAAGLVLYILFCRAVPRLHDVTGWLRVGSLEPVVLGWSIATVVVASAALIVWFVFARPDIRDLIEAFVPDWHPAALVVGGVAFSMLNAAVEEGAYRGVIMDALQKEFGHATALVGQAAAFATIHINGFPRGWGGVGLALLFGLLMGTIRQRSAGMLAPWLAHVGADLAIVGIVLGLARP